MTQTYQGDILILKLKDAPKKLKFKKIKKDFIVAEGEATGHYHKLKVIDRPQAKVEIAEDKNGYYLKLGMQTELEHPEHGTQVISPGIYYIGRQYEYDELTEFRRVAD